MIGDGATDNSWNGNATVVTKIRDKVVVSAGYGITFADRPSLERSSLKEMFGPTGTTGYQQSSGTSGSDNRTHNFSMRSNIKLWKNDLTLGVKTSFGESGTSSVSDMALLDADRAQQSGQHTESRNRTKTLPRLGADATYRIRLPNENRLSLYYNYSDNDTEGEYRLRTAYTPTRPDFGRLSQNKNVVQIHSLRSIFWTNSKAAHQFQMSMGYNNRQYTNLSEYYRLDASGGYIAQQELANGLQYTQQVMTLTPQYTYQKKKFSCSLQPSLVRNANEGTFTGTEDIGINYTRLYFDPSVNFSVRVWKNYNLSIEGRTRTTLPSIKQLNPYIDERDPMNRSMGNPGLKPEHNYSGSIGFLLFMKGFSSMKLSLGHAVLTNAIKQVTSTDALGVSTTTYYNVGRRYNTGIYLSSSILAKKWGGLLFDASYAFTRYVSSNRDVGNNRTDGLGVQTTAFFNLWKSANIEFRYSLDSNMGDIQSQKTEYIHSFNFNFAQTIVKNRLFVTLSVSDPLRSHSYVKNTIAGDNFRLSSSNERLGRTANLTVRWNFGRLKDRVAKEDSPM